MNYISKTAAASAGRRISAELRNAVHPGLGVKYDPRIRDTAANAAMRVVDAIEALKSIPAPAEGNEAEAAPDWATLKAKADAAYAAMTPVEQEAMWQAQRESFARSMEPCEHGMRDFEDCPDCQAKARSAAPAQAPGELTELIASLRDTARTFARDDPAPDCGPETYVEWKAADAIAALSQEQRGAVEVKPLKWKNEGLGTRRASSVFGEYVVNDEGTWWLANGAPSFSSDVVKAKAAAQADYEARIRSALAPVHQEAGK